jgi:hypothetical protein
VIDAVKGRLTLSVPEAGRIIYGLGRDASYAAAKRGEIPVVGLGRRLRVPTYRALRDIGFSDETVASLLGVSIPAAVGQAMKAEDSESGAE